MDDKVGLVIYQLMPGGTMNGLWTIAGERGSGKKVLTLIR
jgi:hypothetical protein